jgi:thiol-disulfide isomerase/thioredoxin
MKKKLLVSLLFLVSLLMILPFKASAKTYYDDYKTLNLKEALEAEDIELLNTKYEETDDQAIIYLFRGQGCGYCRSFLSFLNSISEEYGKYFRLVSFEVWNDEANSALMQEVATLTGEAAGGVPYIIIGDQVFPGYISDWDEDIKSAIKAQYDDNSYDVFKELKKSKGVSLNIDPVIIWNFIFVTIGTVIICIMMKKNNEKVLTALENKRSYGKGK